MKRKIFLGLSIVLTLLISLSGPASNVRASSDLWYENFDSYTDGTQIIGTGGWVPWWDINPEQDAHVSSSQSQSTSNSLAVTGITDIVRPFTGADSGRWVLTVWQYIPETFNELTYMGILNDYGAPSTANYSMWICFDALSGEVYDDYLDIGSAVPLVKGAWEPIRIEVDLDYINDSGYNVGWQKVYYNNTLIYETEFKNSGSSSIAGLAVYSSDSGLSGTVYYDNMSLGNPIAAVNDNFSSATVLTGTSGTEMASNIAATGETGEPWIADFLNKTASEVHSLWWVWTAPQDGNVSFDTIGSTGSGGPNLDTIMSVYTGSSINSLTEIARNDDFSTEDQYPNTCHNSSLVFKAVSDTAYYIAADGYRDLTGEIVLNWAYVTPPANDDFPGITINGTNGTAASDNTNASRESGEPHHYENTYDGYTEYGQSSIWWTWTAPESGDYIFDNGTQYDPPYSVIGIYTGNSINTLSLLVNGFSRGGSNVVLHAEAGTTYRIVTDGEDSNYCFDNGAQNLNWNKLTAPTFTSADNAAFKAGTSGSFTITADGYPAPSISYTGGSMSSGVTFNKSTHTLSGTPVAGTGGSYSLAFEAYNDIAPNGTQNFTLTVNEAPRITSSNTFIFSEGFSGTFTVTTTGYPTSSAVTLDSGTLPSGVTFNSSTKTLSGIPAAGTSGIYPLTFKADNGITPNDSQSFTLTVNGPPKITVQPQNAVTAVGSTAVFTVTYTALPGASLQWQLSTRSDSKWTNISGASLATYTTPNTTTRMSGYQYRVVITNGIGSPVISNAAMLTVMPGSFETADISIEKLNGVYDYVTSNITWTISVHNPGTAAAAGITVSDSLQTGTRLVSIDLNSIPGASSKVRGRNVTVDIGQMAPGTSVTFTITVNVSRAASPVYNTVVLTSATSYDPILTNNTDTGECSW